MKDDYLKYFMIFKLGIVMIGFILTILAQIKDVEYDNKIKEIEKIQDDKIKNKQLEELDDSHQIVITFTLVALILLFLETLSTSSAQLYLYLFDGKTTNNFEKRISKLENILR